MKKNNERMDWIGKFILASFILIFSIILASGIDAMNTEDLMLIFLMAGGSQ